MRFHTFAVASAAIAAFGCTRQVDGVPSGETNMGDAAARLTAPAAVAREPTEGGASKDANADADPSTVDAAPPGVALAPECGDGPDVDFRGNTALEAAIRAAVGRPEGPIPRDRLAGLTTVNLIRVRLDQLDPCIFPLMTGVRNLFLGPSALSDLQPLSNMEHLATLQASFNAVGNLAPLANMTGMDRLDLEGTKVMDLAPIGKMTSLTELQLDGTPITDISPLASCINLEKVSLRNTHVTDLSPLQNAKKLHALAIEGSPIKDTSVLSSIRGLNVVRKGRL